MAGGRGALEVTVGWVQLVQVLQKSIRESTARATGQPNLLRKRDFESELLDRLLNDPAPAQGALLAPHTAVHILAPTCFR